MINGRRLAARLQFVQMQRYRAVPSGVTTTSKPGHALSAATRRQTTIYRSNETERGREVAMPSAPCTHCLRRLAARLQFVQMQRYRAVPNGVTTTSKPGHALSAATRCKTTICTDATIPSGTQWRNDYLQAWARIVCGDSPQNYNFCCHFIFNV